MTVVLDPAPVRDLPIELYPLASVITPNEAEAASLTGEDSSTEEGIARAARVLLGRGVPAVIVKAGERGAYLARGKEFIRVPGFPVCAVDTVGAGDSFNAGLALALAEGKDYREATVFANAVGALSTTKEGAQGAMPGRAEVEILIGEKIEIGIDRIETGDSRRALRLEAFPKNTEGRERTPAFNVFKTVRPNPSGTPADHGSGRGVPYASGASFQSHDVEV
jgi:bifunctional ADP-heptose synthase (sugar kinase/adenylyltransferase)